MEFRNYFLKTYELFEAVIIECKRIVGHLIVFVWVLRIQKKVKYTFCTWIVRLQANGKHFFRYINASYIFRRKMLYELRLFFMDHVEFCQLAV